MPSITVPDITPVNTLVIDQIAEHTFMHFLVNEVWWYIQPQSPGPGQGQAFDKTIYNRLYKLTGDSWNGGPGDPYPNGFRIPPNALTSNYIWFKAV